MERLERLVRLLRRGLLTGGEIQRELGISQPVLSRLIREAGPRVRRFGRSVATRYGLPREVAGVGSQVPVYRVDEHGRPVRHGVLSLLACDASWLERESGGGELFPGLPPFVSDLRFQGYIGRGVPARFPELKLPDRIRDWGEDDHLAALARRGEDGVGNLIVGEESMNRFLAGPPRAYTRADYPRLAAGALAGEPGSSAGGEHPKFGVFADGRHVLVKFAAGDGAAADRWRDLLACEHLGLGVLRDANVPVPAAAWFDLDGTRYLEVERFDRVGRRGRRGVISLEAVNAHYLDPAFDGWGGAGRRILAAGLKLDAAHADRMIWLDAFGDLIGNTDRHYGNLSFFAEEAREPELTLAPAYDMLPMVFAPAGATVAPRPFAPHPPTALNMHLWGDAAAHAREFWSRAGDAAGLTDGFRQTAADCRDALDRLTDRHG